MSLHPGRLPDDRLCERRPKRRSTHFRGGERYAAFSVACDDQAPVSQSPAAEALLPDCFAGETACIAPCSVCWIAAMRL
ncbi:hypothetical protein SAMN05428963_12327 [Consotaella salsifontis]|uniref:Uncharacterized protein n=1 Tax=Consotaella salsifontis TaxID=1365950 RepID=A0A1T4TBB4_9HYPH|nr:hypothetical protein SAMN05428963_12327 [Consotaella salsifontis]